LYTEEHFLCTEHEQGCNEPGGDVHCHDPLLVWVPANDRMAEQTFTDNLGAGKGEEQGREMGEEGDEEGKE